MRPSFPRRVPLDLVLVVVLLLTGSLAACSQWGGEDVALEPETTTSTTGADRSPSVGDQQPGATDTPALDWSGCDGGLECADLEVPLDHDDPGGETLTIALARRPARNQDERIGSVVINPGGPGASGIEAVGYLPVPGPVADRFDVVGFDPRGVGASSPIDCHTHLQAIYDADPTMDDAADIDHYRQVSQAFVDECEAEHADVLPHLGTVDVAHDLDLIRAALGDEQLTYLGYSYGTSIGQHYARLYPERVRAMVLDGVVDLTQSGLEGAEGQAEGFTRAMDAYIADCDASQCLDPSAGAVIDQVAAAAEAQPIAATSADRPATPGVVSLALGRALYSEFLWPQLTRALQQAGTGDGSGLVGLADDYLDRQPDGSYSNGFEIYFAVSCLDSPWPDSFEAVLQNAEEVGARYPRVGEALVNDYARCALWPEDPQPLEPVPADVEGLPPIVLVSTTGDPATPYESGVKVAEAIPDARLVTNVGEGHTIVGNGKPCIDDAVARYLVDLTAPEDGLRCE